MSDNTLFTDKSGRSDPRQYDVDQLNILIARYEKRKIDPKHIAICPEKLISIVDLAHARLSEFEKPGPFKKAAVLSMSLMAHSPFYYLLNEVEAQQNYVDWEWDLAAVVSTGITRLYLTVTLPVWEGRERKPITPPSPVSPHFMDDFRALLKNRHETMDMRMLALVWELKTYLANPDCPLQKTFEHGIEPSLPGLKP